MVDNIVLSLPPPPVQNLTGAFSNGVWLAQFNSRSNWLYSLQRSPDLQLWSGASVPVIGTGTVLALSDTNPPPNRAWYRVRADKP
jgi:hypothetical protein